MATTHDEQWMPAFKNGDPTVFSHVFRLFYRPLCYYARSMVDHDAEAEDLVTETMVKLWRLRANFEKAGKMKAFLYISVRNACLDHLKYTGRKVPHQEEYAYYHSIEKDLEENNNFISAQITRAEVLHEIHCEINALPRKCRAVFMMSFLDGLKNDEIANTLNLSYNTVKAQKVRALKLLRFALLKKEFLLTIKIFFFFF